MIRRDMPEVLEIENDSFEFSWSEDDFVRCLRQRNCIGMVAEHDERIVGFMIYELHKNRLHVLNFAVRDDLRRRGIGSQMMRKLVQKLSNQRRNRIISKCVKPICRPSCSSGPADSAPCRCSASSTTTRRKTRT